MKRWHALLTVLLIGCASLVRSDPPSLAEEGELVIQNRLLAKVNGKTISVIDLVKRMDMQLSRYYPEHAHSPSARYQFFSARWRDTLDEMIDNELMLSDAADKEIQVSDGEVRETMQERFGPNIVASLDKIGLTYDEARELIHTEMTVQRMQWYKINAKAIHTVNPQDIRESYKQFCLKNPPTEEWKYQVLSIRAENSQVGAELADEAYNALLTQKSELAALADQLRARVSETQKAAISLSQDFNVDSKSISESHKEALFSLAAGEYSRPIAQVSRIDRGIVYRIFYLKEHSKKETPGFEEISSKLEDALISEAIGKEAALYLSKLRQHYGYSPEQLRETVPADFEPFALRR
jgi:hypothetical protein